MENEKNYCTMYIVRHAQSESNIQNILTASRSPLSKTGIKQAKELNKTFRDIHFDAIFSSDFLRAKQTAKLSTLERNLAIQTSKLLREKSYGHYDDRSTLEYRTAVKNALKQIKTISSAERGKLKVSYTEDSEDEVASRFIRFIREVAVAYANKTVLIVSHGTAMRVFLTHLGYAKVEELIGAISNAAYVKITSDGLDFFVKETSGIIKNKLS